MIGSILTIENPRGYARIKGETNQWRIAEIVEDVRPWLWIVNVGNPQVQARYSTRALLDGGKN